jgi:hypothetical protein
VVLGGWGVCALGQQGSSHGPGSKRCEPGSDPGSADQDPGRHPDRLERCGRCRELACGQARAGDGDGAVVGQLGEGAAHGQPHQDGQERPLGGLLAVPGGVVLAGEGGEEVVEVDGVPALVQHAERVRCQAAGPVAERLAGWLRVGWWCGRLPGGEVEQLLPQAQRHLVVAGPVEAVAVADPGAR